jgi:hypothetical protein
MQPLTIDNDSEMLWIEYEASEHVEPEMILTVLKRISEFISPYPVAAVDEGQFRVGLIACATPEPEDSTHGNTSNEPGNDWNWEDGDGGGNQDQGGNAPRPPNDDQNGSGRIGDGDGRGDKDDGVPADQASATKKRKPAIFTGDVTVYCGDSMTQHLKTSFGLAISPTADYERPNFQVNLDSIVVVASSTSRDGEGDSLFSETLDPIYVIDNVCIQIIPSEGHIAAPVATRPQKRHFVRSITTERQIHWSVDVTASVAPSGSLGLGGEKSTATEHDPIGVGLVPKYIGGGGGNGFEWRYSILGESDTHVEMSSRNPPIHEATYVVHTSHPKFINVGVQTAFRRKKRLLPIRRGPLGAYFRVFNDVQVMHMRSRLDVKLASQGREFVFPANKERGVYLEEKAEMRGRKKLLERSERGQAGASSPEAILSVG